LDNLHPWGLAGYVHNPNHEHEKFNPATTKMVFVRHPIHFKGYVMCGKYPNGGMMEINYCNVNFLRDEFASIGEIKKKNLEQYEL